MTSIQKLVAGILVAGVLAAGSYGLYAATCGKTASPKACGSCCTVKTCPCNPCACCGCGK